MIEVQKDLYDKNLYVYCDNNPIHRIDENGNAWSQAIVLSSSPMIAMNVTSLKIAVSSIVAAAGSITPIGWAIGSAVVLSAVVIYVAPKVVKKISNRSVVNSRITTMSKGGNQRIKDSGLAGLSDAEISRRARDKSLSKKERERYKKEEKARDLRNKQKGQGKYRGR